MIRRPTLVPVVLAASTIVLLTGAPALASAPDGCISTRGYLYGSVVNHGLVLDGMGTPKIFHNGTSSTATQSLAQSSTGTSQWSVNGSVSVTGSYEFGPIKAGVTATVGGSYTTSNGETQTVTATISIKPGYYGILQGGVFRRYTTGHYYYDNGNCTYTTGSTISVKIPVVADGYDSTTNTSGNVPWDQH